MAVYPTIIVPGIGQSKTVLTDTGRTAWPLDVDTEKFKKAVLLPAVRMLILRHDLGFEKALRGAVADVLEPLRCVDNGDRANPVQVVMYEKSIAECDDGEKRFIRKMMPVDLFVDTIGAENLFYFTFNPFGAADETVERLRTYVEMVKEKTGAERVNLISVSLGGTIVTQYLDKYVSCGDIHRLVGIVSAFDGSRVVSGLFQKKVTMQKVWDLLDLLLSRKVREQLDKYAPLLPKKLLERYVKAVEDLLLEVLLLRCPMMWGAVPAKLYEALRDSLLSDERFSALRQRTDASFRVRRDFPALVEKCKTYGTEIFSLCGNGVPLFLVDDDTDSDGIVHLPSCMMADTLEESPIRSHTWIFEGMGHEGAATEKALLELCSRLIADDSITDVESDSNFPQRQKSAN